MAVVIEIAVVITIPSVVVPIAPLPRDALTRFTPLMRIMSVPVLVPDRSIVPVPGRGNDRQQNTRRNHQSRTTD